MEQLFIEKPLCRCFLGHDHTPCLLYRECDRPYNFPSFSCFLRLTEDFLFISFQQKNEIKKDHYKRDISVFV